MIINRLELRERIIDNSTINFDFPLLTKYKF